jgi:hypothetical protein
VIEDRGNTRIVRDGNGVTKEEGKFLGSIPKHLSHTLVDRATWEAEFKPRLNGKDPSRQPADWNVFVNAASHPDRPYPLSIGCGSLYGWLRDWMGMENLSLLVYDAPDLFEEMVETLADCIIDTITPALEAGVQFDFASMWEDMCYRSGPLLSPKIFKRVLVPNYKRITGLLKNHGCDVVVLDCDGDIRKLLPLWLEGGVNCMFPIEVGTWGLATKRIRARPLDGWRCWKTSARVGPQCDRRGDRSAHAADRRWRVYPDTGSQSAARRAVGQLRLLSFSRPRNMGEKPFEHPRVSSGGNIEPDKGVRNREVRFTCASCSYWL